MYRALDLEYRDKGIIIQSVCPLLVSTKMSKTKEQFGVPSPENYVISALKTIKTQSITNGCLFHNFQVIIKNIWAIFL
jgi:short-subunit dehydrogenase